jgi:hypothetical protein
MTPTHLHCVVARRENLYRKSPCLSKMPHSYPVTSPFPKAAILETNSTRKARQADTGAQATLIASRGLSFDKYMCDR